MHRMERTHLLLLIILLSVQSCSIAVAAQIANITTTDQSALLALKSQITNDPQNFLTTNWSTTTASNVCTWIGVTCAAGHLRVAALNLSYMDLTGTIPPHIGNLSFLVQMDFKNNSFHGTLPQELGFLRRLELISLRYNNFGGTIPSWFGSLSNLQTFDLYGNQFLGSVPSAIFNLSALQLINLSYNQLSGTIPKEIGNLTMLKALYLDQNDFEEIPTLIGSKDQLERLYLQFNALKGPVPTHVFNMSSLIVLALNQNNLNGSIPDNLCQYLPSLQWLYLGYNRLDGPLPSKFGEYCKQLQRFVLERNNISGSIPKNIGNLTQLLVMNVQNNNLEGIIPDEIGNLPNLQSLLLNKNNLDGSIPPNVGNLTQLVNFDLAYNNLSGSIPDEIHDLRNLEILSINVNTLNGLIPSTIFNMSSIRVIGLTHNQLSGSLPANIGPGLPYLEGFYVAENYLTGEIPNFVSNGSSKLTRLEMSKKLFTGFVPSNLCSLTNLELLSMHSTNLTIDTSTPEANILLCLANLTMLTYMALSDNPLNATLPVSLGNLSASLEYFNLGNCNMRGNIPNDIGNLSSLTTLGLEYNQLDGSIPSSIGRLHNLQGLYLTGNNLQGSIPSELCQLENLYELYLGGNQLSGSIPSCLDNLAPTLRNLSLGSNFLTSSIPSTLWQLEYVLNLDLSSNLLDGHLTEDIGNLKVVTAVNFSDNRFSGSIPTRIGDLQDLVNLSLSNNNLGGSIPSSVGKLLELEILDLSRNNISGVIPKSLEALLHLTILDLSFNKLQGEIPIGGPFRNFTPQSYLSNAGLCGNSLLNVPPCKNGTGIRPNARKSGTYLLKYIVPPIISAILLVSSILIFIKCRKRRVEDATKTTLSPQLPWKRVSRLELERATNAFDESNLLGTGGFGSVYKGTISNGMIVAVKVFNLQLEGAFRSFDSEFQVLSNIRHRNLIKIISCCSELDFKALVLQYMPKGSLEKWLYSEDSPLSLLQRLNIMIDVASALEYLHHDHDYTEHIVHCDVKPSNILIDNDMVGHVADFGIAKLLGGGNSMSQTMTLATIGYMAPEYGREGIVSRRGDVYSFGIMLMETLTKRKPTDEMFGGKINMKQWIADSLFADGALLDVVDADLLVTEEDDNFVTKRDCLASIFRLALACSAQSPEERISMQDAAVILNRIKTKFLKDCRELKS